MNKTDSRTQYGGVRVAESRRDDKAKTSIGYLMTLKLAETSEVIELTHGFVRWHVYQAKKKRVTFPKLSCLDCS